MRVLLANKFYYRRGGDCIVTMNLEQLLKSKGHEVAVFSMDYPENVDSPWKKYWPSNMTKVKAFFRPFGDEEVRCKFLQLLDDFHPDVVHLQNIHTQLSPVIAEIAHNRGIRVVWTLHDTKLVCPCYTCMRNGKWCEECFSNKTAVIKHRCMPGSVPGAIIGYLEQKKWNIDRLCACTDLFLPPSRFMMDTCVRGGYDSKKFKVLCNFINIDKVLDLPIHNSFTSEDVKKLKKDYYCYLGRVTDVKGIRTLCKAASAFPYRLKVIGGGDLLDELRQDYPNIEFLGQMDWKEFRHILEEAKFMVLPSEWSENNPLTVIESQSLGTPVLGARIGGIPELINETGSSVNDGTNSRNDAVSNGMTFTSGDVEDLKDKIQLMWNAEFDYVAIAKDAVLKYSSEAYYKNLMEFYK